MKKYLSEIIDLEVVDYELFESFLHHINYYSTVEYAKNIDNFLNINNELQTYETGIKENNKVDITEQQIGCAA